MADLYRRLKTIRERERESPRGGNSSRSDSIPARRADFAAPPDRNAAEWYHACPLVWTRSVVHVLGPEFQVLPDTVARLECAWKDFSGIRFFDTETTGLSGGAGTWIFLMGLSRLQRTPQGIVLALRQFFLEDLGGEADFVDLIEQELAGVDLLVSYNGASFDLPLLKTRWIMNGREFPLIRHFDCLHPARRFWRTLCGKANLGSIEAEILGVVRIDDIPGAMVPRLYLDYLKQGAGPDFSRHLDGVFLHHLQDMVSLAAIYLVIRAIQENPADHHWQLWMPGDGPSSGLRVQATALAVLVPRELAPSLIRPWCQRTMGKSSRAWLELLARLCKQAARQNSDPVQRHELFREASELWLKTWQDHADFPSLVELLKYYEHQGGRPGKQMALDLIIQARSHPLARIPECLQELDHRQARIAAALAR